MAEYSWGQESNLGRGTPVPPAAGSTLWEGFMQGVMGSYMWITQTKGELRRHRGEITPTLSGASQRVRVTIMEQQQAAGREGGLPGTSSTGLSYSGAQGAACNAHQKALTSCQIRASGCNALAPACSDEAWQVCNKDGRPHMGIRLERHIYQAALSTFSLPFQGGGGRGAAIRLAQSPDSKGSGTLGYGPVE